MKYDVSKIRSLIAKRGLNEADFLHLPSVALGAKTLIRWENGTERPREDHVSYIAKALGVNVSELIYNQDKQINNISNTKAVLCPQHHKELKIERVILTVLDDKYSVVTGTCSECNIKYTNRVFFRSGTIFSVGKERYQFLDDLGKVFPYTQDEDINNCKQQEKSFKHTNEPADLHLRERQVKNVHYTKTNDYFEVMKQRLAKSPDMVVYPTKVVYLDKIPTRCPVDSELLRKLRVPYLEVTRGHCCIRCGRLYLPESYKNLHVGSEKWLESKHEAELNLPLEITDTPESTILLAQICTPGNKHAIGSVAIVADDHEQNTHDGIYWVGRALPSAILAAIQSSDHYFVYKDIKYQVGKVVTYKETTKYLKIISRFCNPFSPQTVYVFTQKNITHFQHDNFEMVTAMVPCSNRIYPVPITVYYDKVKQEYFINEATYISARQSFGLPYLRLKSASGQNSLHGFLALKPHSELNLLGYNVNSTDGLSTELRRNILRDAIDSGILWKSEVINHLEWLIHTRGNIPNMEKAVGEWQDDLRYISNYHATEQRKIWISKFKSRYMESSVF